MIKGVKRPVIIAGPCSLESERQLNEIVEELEELKVDMIRFGVWKPRTDPKSFQGLGEKGLKWIEGLKPLYRDKITVEVANSKQVELALKYKINKVWIGARTTTSPFAVQEIADALKGTKTLVMVKNPINPDIKLWLGAFERLNQAGIERTMAIYRGFQTGYEQRYRNTPLWDIPLKLAHELPQIPILCDPSHIAGDAKRILEISMYAKQLNFDGYMIEVHPDPEHALSDAKQQLNVSEFKEFMEQICSKVDESQIMKYKQYATNYFKDQVNTLQKQIDFFNRQIQQLQDPNK